MKKRIKQVLNKQLLLILLFVGMCSIFSVNVFANSHTKALEHSAIKQVSKENKADVNYSFAFAANEKSRIRPFGNTGKIISATSDATSEGYDCYDSKWIMPNNSENGKVGFWIENVGIYRGNVIDLKITYSWINKVSSDGLEYKPSIGLTLCKDGKIGMNFSTRAYEANTEIYSNGQKITIDKLSFTFGDIDDYQFFGFKPLGEVKEIQCSEDSTVYYQKVGDIHFMYANAGGYPDTPNASLRFEINNLSGYEFIIGKDNAYGDYGLTNNEDGFTPMSAFSPNDEGAKYWYTIWEECFESWGTTVTETKLVGDLNARNQGYAWGYFTGHSYSEYDVSPPIKSVSDIDETEVILNTLENKEEIFIYKVSHFVPEAWEEFYFSSYEIVDTLPACLEVRADKVKILDTAKINVSNKFNIKVEGQEINIQAKPEELAKPTFYAQTYEVVIDTKIKEGVDLTPFYSTQINGIELTNKAVVVIDGQSKESNVVKTRLTEKPNVLIKKIVVDGQLVDEHTVEQVSETITFKGDVTIQNIKKITSIILEDELHQAFRYQPDSLQVFDTDGNDITEHGEIQVEGQLVRFTFDKDYVPKLIDTKFAWMLTVHYIGGAVRNIEIPNTMTLFVNEEVRLSPPVFIIPPEEDDKIVKSIVLSDNSEVEQHILSDNEEDITFKGIVVIGNNAEVESVILEDNLHPAFMYQKDSLQVFDQAGENITDYGKIYVEGQKIRFVFDEEYAPTLLGSEIIWLLTVNYVEGFDLTELQNDEIPNKMQLIVNEKGLDSNEVTVIPRETELIPPASKDTPVQERKTAAKTGDIENMRTWVVVAGLTIVVITIVVGRHKLRR